MPNISEGRIAYEAGLKTHTQSDWKPAAYVIGFAMAATIAGLVVRNSTDISIKVDAARIDAGKAAPIEAIQLCRDFQSQVNGKLKGDKTLHIDCTNASFRQAPTVTVSP